MPPLQFPGARAGATRQLLRHACSALLAGLLATASVFAAAAAPVLAPSQLEDGTDADTSPLGTRVPLVLVHGLGGSPQGWDNFLHVYQGNAAWRSAFKPYSFRYSTSNSEVSADPLAPRSLPALGSALGAAMQAFYDKPVAAPDFGWGRKRAIVLAHSMGGLVARSMMQEYAFRDGQRGGQKVLQLITLGTPHHGSPLADAAMVLGLGAVSELSDTWPGFLANLAWDNHDGLNMLGGKCNPWLARLNTHAPLPGAGYGNCGFVAGDPLPGYYEKIIAYGASSLQSKDTDSGALGSYKPGSSSSYQFTYQYLLTAYGRAYANDGIVPVASAQFAGWPVWQRRDAYGCDHRLIKGGYVEFVRSATATYTDSTFCAATTSPPIPSGVSGGYAIGGTIYGDQDGIGEVLRTVSQAERVFDWAEQAYAGYLQPAGAATELWNGYRFRWYPADGAYVGVKDGNVYYMGPASGGALQWQGTLADLLLRAQSAGF